MSYLFGKLCDQGISWHWKNDVRSWFKAARNFVFTPDSNRTLIWHCLIWGHHLQGPRHIVSVLLGEGRFEDKGKFIQSDFSGYCQIKAIKAHVFIFPVSPQICPQSQSLHFCTLATFRLVADNGSWHPGRSIVAFFAPPTWSSGAASRPFGPWQRHVTSGLTGSIQATMTCTQLN